MPPTSLHSEPGPRAEAESLQISLRAAADHDVDVAVDYYRTEAGAETALAFVDCFEAAIDHLRRHPFTGSLRFAFELEIPDLRTWRLERFPYLLFYVADDNKIDVWRVLHARRDIPAYLTDESSD